jgi:H+-transporting ATPase
MALDDAPSQAAALKPGRKSDPGDGAAFPSEPAQAKPGPSRNGLTQAEAQQRLSQYGPNAMPDTSLHPLRMALEKFWAPVPWMLEAAIVFELALGKYVEAAIIALLLVFNAALSLFPAPRQLSPH